MRQTLIIMLFLLLAGLITLPAVAFAASRRNPNIVLIYTDDVGYGDLSCYGAQQISTPQLDRLAAEGLRFTDAHCTSATCTPSRFGLLTGQYPWRRARARILRGDAPLLIAPGTHTIASVLKSVGYSTAVVGKWHLGLGDGNVDWNAEVKPGPLEIGFDYSFLIPATGDRVPCVYLENYRVVGLDPADPITVSYGMPIPGEPTGKTHPELLKMRPSRGHNMSIVNGISRKGHMKGGKSALWVDEDMADVITERAVKFIAEQSEKEAPFFLFFSTHDIHVPRAPHSRFVGKSNCGPRGDTMVEIDWCVGELSKALAKHGFADNTLILFSSDNGPVLDDGYQDDAIEKRNGHEPAGPWRAGKYSSFEGGTRVPLIAHYPKVIEPGVSSALFSQVDLLASLAELTGATLPAAAGPDSLNALPALIGKDKTGRGDLVSQGGGLSLRVGPWKYIPPGQKILDGLGPWKRANSGATGMLFNVELDPGETTNLVDKHPRRAKEFAARLKAIRTAERTRP